MKRVTGMASRTLRLASLAAGMLLAQNALAVGTPAGTPVDNTASATYGRFAGRLIRRRPTD